MFPAPSPPFAAACALFSLPVIVGMAHAQDGGTSDAGASDAGAVQAPSPRPPVLTRAPSVMTPPRPVYPAEALADRRAADVELQLDLDAQGRVTAVAVTNPAGHGFDEAAVAAAREMRFEPALIDGQPGAIRIAFVVRFRPPPPTTVAPLPAPSAPPAPPHPIVLRGRLRERGTRDPIAGASVFLQPAGATTGTDEPATGTDEDGRFELRGPPGTQVRVVVSSGAHEPCIRALVLPSAGQPPLSLDCRVDRRDHGLETVVEAPRERHEATRHTLAQRELATVPGTFGDPLRAVQNLPGIARTPYGLGQLVIRGSSPNDSGVYIDGHKVPLLYHFLAGPSVLTPDLVGRIDFHPGGFGVRYGRASAGVIDVTTVERPVTRLHGSADLDLLDASATLEAPLGGGWSGTFAARRSTIDAVLPRLLADQPTMVTPVYWDYQGRIARDFGGGQRLSLLVLGSHDHLEAVSQDPGEARLNLGSSIGFQRVILSWRRALGTWTSTLSPMYGHDTFGIASGAVAGSSGAHVFGLRQEVGGPVTSSLHLALGLDGQLRLDRYDFRVPVPPDRPSYGQTIQPLESLGRSLANLGLGLWAEARWDVTPTVRVVPGLRFDWFHYFGTDRLSVDPRVMIRWARSPRQTFVVGAGVFHQSPEAQQLDRQFGNPALPLIWADQYHLGLEQRLGDRLSLEATAFALRRHEIPLSSTRRDPEGRPLNFLGEGRGRAYGLELRLRHDVTENFYGWISYTLSRSEAIEAVRATPETPLPDYRPTSYDQTHNLIVVASRKLGGWEVGGRFRLVSGVPITPVVRAVLDADHNEYDPVAGIPRSERRQLFHQLDLRVERTWTFQAWRLSAYLDVQNVFNAQNPESTVFDYRYRQSAPVRGLPFLPVLGVKGRF